MAGENDRSEKTEEATQQRREDFRKRGQVAQTRELAAVFVIMGSVLMIMAFSQYFMSAITELFNQSFHHFFLSAARDGDWITAASFAIKKTFVLVAPVMALFLLIAACSSVLQIGFLYNEEALQFKPERLDPVQGLKRMFSLKSVIEGIKALIKLIIIGTVTWLVLKHETQNLPSLVEYGIGQMFTYLGEVVLRLLIGVGCVMAVLAGADFLFQRWDLEKEMMMTKEEVKEEHKSREGDPLVRARIKRVQREIANRRMMEQVPKADVIITNPTHIACALRYDETMVAPRLLAKGGDLIAEKIKEIARAHNIPIVENKPLARTIFKTLKIGQTIPKELYTAVAEVLAYVFKLRKRAL